MQYQSLLEDLPRRVKGPYSQTRFKAIKVVSNLAPVTCMSFWALHIFSISISPRIMADDKSKRSQLMQSILPMLKMQIRNPVLAGMNVFSVEEPIEPEGTYQSQGHSIHVKLVKTISQKNPELLLSFLNNGLSKMMQSIGYCEIGRSGRYFNLGNPEKLSNLLLYRGFKANFVKRVSGMHLRIDSITKVTQNTTVLAFIDNLCRLHKQQDRDERRAIIKAELISKIVMTNYGKLRYLPITDVQFVDMNQQLLIVGEGSMTVPQYYKEKYNISIGNTSQPLLISRNRNRKDTSKVYLVPELCLMTGIPGDIDEVKRKRISQITTQTPPQKKETISSLMKSLLNAEGADTLKEIGVKVRDNESTIQASLIQAPRILLGDCERVPPGKEQAFSLSGKPIYDPKVSINMGVLYFDQAFVNQTMAILREAASKFKLSLTLNKLNLGKFDHWKALQTIIARARQAKQAHNNILLVVLPNSLAKQYKDLKKALLEIGISSQIILENNIKKGQMPVLINTLLQIAVKVGNTLWVPETPELSAQGMMLIGLDVSTRGNDKVVVGVATTSLQFSSYFVSCETFQDCDKLQKFKVVMLSLVQGFVKASNRVPSQIIVFASDLTSTSIALFREYFTSQTLQQIEEFFAQKIRMTVVLVNSRSSERFFLAESMGGSYRNVAAGTLVTEQVVGNGYDFYLISQYSTKGTAIPTHYNVIYSNSRIEQGVLQSLIYSQCFNYANWQGSIKIPGILKYAKKCSRFQSLVECRQMKDLSHSLYFI